MFTEGRPSNCIEELAHVRTSLCLLKVGNVSNIEAWNSYDLSIFFSIFSHVRFIRNTDSTRIELWEFYNLRNYGVNSYFY